MTHSSLLDSIYTKISGIAGLPTILYPNRKYTTPPSEYVSINVMPIPTATATFDGGILQSGLIQCSIVVPVDIGEIKAAGYADIIIAALPNTTVISDNLKVSRPTYASGGIVMDNGSYMMPVTIQYGTLSR